MIVREGRLDPPKVQRILGELAMALHHAHEHGVVHRDVKPENILVDRDTGRPMLTDFGIARALEKEGTLTGLGVLLGSPRYMSPEQATGDASIDGRSDLYALSLVGYEMLTGRAVVDAPSAAAMLVKHLNETPKPIAEVVPWVPPDLAKAITVGLEKNRDQRWSSGRAMAEALGVAAPSDAAHASTTRYTSRRMQLAAAALTAIVATTAGALWWRGRDVPSLQSYVVVPFEVQSANADVKWLREGAVNMLTLSLSQWQDLTVTNYERTLDLVEDAGVAEGARVSLDAALDVAQRANAGSLVMGQISTTADSLIVVASLYDARSGKQVNRVPRAAPIGADPRPVFDQVSRYLLEVAGGTAATTVDLAKATTTSLAAYRYYLEAR
jgi:serine/threonine-protein kinase